jgi:hypothetical protein
MPGSAGPKHTINTSMKTKFTLLAGSFAALALSSSAQIVPDPSGVNTFSAASAFNSASYASKFGAGGMNLYFASQAFAPSAEVNTWTPVTQYTDIAPAPTFLPGGGTVKTIFLGESAGVSNDFGFIKTGNDLGVSSNYKALATNIVNTNTPGGTIQSGWETYVNYGAGETLDFWLNNPGSAFGPGGAYFAFLQSGVGSAFAGGDPYTHSKFKWTSVMTEYQDLTGTTVRGNVDTLLIAFEDLRGPALPPGGGLPVIPPGDGDYTDFLVAFQFLPTQVAVPEPSTYGLMGVAALLALVGYRRFKPSTQVHA